VGHYERVKYADGPTVQVEMVVEAPVDVVWSLVTDISLPARFSTEFCGATWIDPPALGARFHGRSRHDALGEWETVSFVSRYESPKAFAWEVGDPDNPSASWWFELHEQTPGVLVRYGARIGPAPSGLSIAITAMPDKEERIIARRLQEFERNMTATLHGVKALAEGAR